MKSPFVVVLVACALVLPPASGAPAPSAGSDPAVSQVREDSYYPAIGDPSVDVLHYGLVLDWGDVDRELTGVATLRFRWLDAKWSPK